MGQSVLSVEAVSKSHLTSNSGVVPRCGSFRPIIYTKVSRRLRGIPRLILEAEVNHPFFKQSRRTPTPRLCLHMIEYAPLFHQAAPCP
jgi:hypothetical protein